MTPILIGLALLYFAPSLFAILTGRHNTAAIVTLNLFLGWTLLGWVFALVWAVSEPPPKGCPDDPMDGQF